MQKSGGKNGNSAEEHITDFITLHAVCREWWQLLQELE